MLHAHNPLYMGIKTCHHVMSSQESKELNNNLLKTKLKDWHFTISVEDFLEGKKIIVNIIFVPLII